VEQIKAFFLRHFKWTPGEYDLELNIIADQEDTNVNRKYRFSLFESESKKLSDYADTYRTGAGLYWISNEQAGILLPVHKA